MRPPRILFVYQFLTLGGVEVVMQTRLKELGRRGIQARMLFLAESRGGEAIFEKMGDQVAVHTSVTEIEKYLRDFNPDWISTIDTPEIIPIARRAVPEARIAYEVHTPYSAYYDLVLDRDLLDGVSGILVPSQSQKEFIALRLARPLPIEVVPNSTPKEFFQTPQSALEAKPAKRNIVMWVGRLDELKNWRGFIQLAARVRKRIESEFWIVGGLHNHEESNLLEAVQTAGLMDSFRWLPAVPYEDMPRLYSFVGASGGCLVSTSWGESFGMAALEAMASRCPVIASDVVGLRDIVRPGETGWLYPSMDLDRACDFVLEALQDQSAREKLVENAELEARKLTPALTVDRLLGLFADWSAIASNAETFSSERKKLVDKLKRNAESQAARLDSLSRRLEEREQATRELTEQLAEKGKLVESLAAQVFEKAKPRIDPCLVLLLPAGNEEARSVIRTTAFWRASLVVAVSESGPAVLELDPSLREVTLLSLSDDSFGSFLRLAAGTIAEGAPASADVVVVDATRFDIKTALAVIKSSRDENPEAAIVSAIDFTSENVSQRASLGFDLGASWIERELWDEVMPRLASRETVSECNSEFADAAQQRSRAVVLAPISPLSHPLSISQEERSSLGDAVSRQQQLLLRRVGESKGAVIFLPSMAWDSDFVQRPHHLARQFARLGYVSIYHSTSLRDALIGFREIEPNLYIFFGPEAFLNAIPDSVIWAFTYNYALSDSYPDSARIVYDLIDDIEVFPGDVSELEEKHSRALREADVVATVSRRLVEQISHLRPDAIYLPNAVEAERFADDSSAVPNDPDIAALLKEGKPIAGYYGVLADWVDYELVGSLARSRPDWNFLLIGSAYDNSFQERGRRLLDHANVRCIGSRPYEALAGYLRLFDVALIPFVINNVTLSASPLKLYEYFAGGKPVISTAIPECESMPEVQIARTAEEFSQSLDPVKAKGLDKGFQKRVRALAKENSWFARAQTVIEVLKRNAADGTTDRRRPSSDESIRERNAPAPPAVVGEQMVQLLSMKLAETQKIISDRESGISWLLTHLTELEKTIATRDETVERISARLTEHEQREQAFKTQQVEADTLRSKLATAEETVRVRDEAIAWLQTELEESNKRGAALTALNESLTAKLIKWESVLETLTGELADQRERAAALSAELADQRERAAALSVELADQRERAAALSAELARYRERADGLSAEVAHQQKLARSLEARLAENDKRLRHYAGRTDKQEEIIKQRDEGIAWLRGELEESGKKNQRLAGSNNFLKMRLEKDEAAIQNLQQHLSATDLELARIKRSLGWRLLSRYGKIKYRYLLPLYRALNLFPYELEPLVEQRALSSLPTQITFDESAVSFAETATVKQPLEGAATGRIEEHHTLRIEAREVFEAGEKLDFYESVTLLPRLRQEEIAAILDKRPPAEPLHRQDVICFSIIDWEFRYQRPQQVMSQFAAHGHRIFYISTSRFLSPDAAPRVAVKRIKENVYEVHLAALRIPDVYGEVIDGDNKAALLDSLDELRRTHRINDAIGYTMIASWGGVALDAKRLWGWRTIYDCMDEWENFPGVKRDLLDMEQRLVQDCDLLVVTAQRLWEKWEPYERTMVLARNGVDIEFYDGHCHPNSILPEIKHPVIGYYGAIADWFDLELMTHAAKARPEYTFVLLGGVFNLDVSELESLPNVRLLGQQPYETMPQYLYHFDVCMIPFKINPITEATDPVKLYEYLSAGKPVVSVALSEVEDYGEYLYIARDNDDFVAKLDAAVEEDNREMVSRRRKFAEQHTWKQRYKTIEAGITLVTPRVSIIIVSYNNLVLNKLCLESLIRNTEYPNYEIIVVDNASKDGTPAYLRYMNARFPNISIILNDGNNGFARANNQGIARSSGDYIVLLNNDTIVPPGWLSRLLRHLENGEIGMIGPLTNFVGNEAKLEVDYQTWGEMEAFAARHVWEHDGESADIYMLAMFCVAFKRDTYDEIGPLDEQFGLGMFEDDDYAQRMKAKGYRVMCAADAFVHHFGQAAFKKLIEDGRYNPLFDENRSYFETKWNVEWVPHVHKRLKFERMRHAALERQAVGKKR
ncbi:MAG TPA: glycosyltransferase [Blastocatellia bacterium]|nr:glycosyltransferase [Blastocatellia bacterium]